MRKLLHRFLSVSALISALMFGGLFTSQAHASIGITCSNLSAQIQYLKNKMNTIENAGGVPRQSLLAEYRHDLALYKSNCTGNGGGGW